LFVKKRVKVNTYYDRFIKQHPANNLPLAFQKSVTQAEERLQAEENNRLLALQQPPVPPVEVPTSAATGAAKKKKKKTSESESSSSESTHSSRSRSSSTSSSQKSSNQRSSDSSSDDSDSSSGKKKSKKRGRKLAKKNSDSSDSDESDEEAMKNGDATKKSKKRKSASRKTTKGGENADSDGSMLDLKEHLRPIGSYIKDRERMLREMFRCIKGSKLQAMLPDILKVLKIFVLIFLLLLFWVALRFLCLGLGTLKKFVYLFCSIKLTGTIFWCQ
jgi:cobalamin biosynthesis Mg chelatase CobN